MIKYISPSYTNISSLLELSSDYTFVLRQIHYQLTNWQEFREAFNTSSLPLRTENDIDTAVDCFSNNIINAIRSSSPIQESIRNQLYPDYIKRKIPEIHKLRRMWHSSRLPKDKRRLNKAAVKLTKVLHNLENYCFQIYLGNLSPTPNNSSQSHYARRMGS